MKSPLVKVWTVWPLGRDWGENQRFIAFYNKPHGRGLSNSKIHFNIKYYFEQRYLKFLRKRKRSESVLWEKSQRKVNKANGQQQQQKTLPIWSITQRIFFIFIVLYFNRQLVWLTKSVTTNDSLQALVQLCSHHDQQLQFRTWRNDSYVPLLLMLISSCCNSMLYGWNGTDFHRN